MLAQDIRTRILAHLAKGSSARMDAAWDLAGFASERMYTQLRDEHGTSYNSLRQWWQGELSSYMEWPEVKRLTELGVGLYPIRPVVDEALRERRKSYRWFSKSYGFLKKGLTTLDEISRCAQSGLPLACDLIRMKQNGENFVSFKIPSNPQERRRLMGRLTRFAIANGFRSPDDALLAILATLDGDVPPIYRPYLARIQDGKFTCALCGKIPNPPTTVQRANGRAGVVCAEPCLAIFQARKGRIR